MKALSICITISVLFVIRISACPVTDSLHGMKYRKDYFHMKDYFNQHKAGLSEMDRLYFGAVVDNAFLKYSQSAEQIAQLEANRFKGIDSASIKFLYDIQQTNYFLQGQYEKAYESSKRFVSDFGYMMDSAELISNEGCLKIFKEIQNVPAMTVERDGEIRLPISRDKANLRNLSAGIGDTTVNLVFDSGANMSLLQRSLAQNAGFEIHDADVPIYFATGKLLYCDVAVAPELKFGKQTITNVVFLVIDDEEVNFPEAHYEINGIVGFPIIHALEEVHFTKNNELVVPEHIAEYRHENMFVNDLMPVVLVNADSDSLAFGFDTGANSTSLYANYYSENKERVDAEYEAQTFEYGSAGGKVSFEGFAIDTLAVSIAGQERSLAQVRLHRDKFGVGDYYDGNLGQDYMSQFDEMILSFKYSSIVFK